MSSICDTRTLLIIAAVFLIAYLFFNETEFFSASKEEEEEVEEVENNLISEEEESEEQEQEQEQEQEEELQELQEEQEESEESQESHPLIPRKSQVTSYMPSNTKDSALLNKFKSRNQAQGKYKTASYNEDNRDQQESSKWNCYFNSNNNVIGGALASTRGYAPVDESGDKYAMFADANPSETCGSNQNCNPEDLFDVDKVLPQEVTDDWFTVLPEPISVKNRHLINVTKPIGINTIGTSLKNSSYDIRGAPSCPKSVVSPFLNSSIEPDLNYKPLF
jgi:hypothetical protein